MYHLISGVTVAQYLAQDQVGVYIRLPSPNADEDYRKLFEIYVDRMQNEADGTGRLHILKINAHDRKNWPEMVEWLHSTLGKFRRVLSEVHP